MTSFHFLWALFLGLAFVLAATVVVEGGGGGRGGERGRGDGKTPAATANKTREEKGEKSGISFESSLAKYRRLKIRRSTNVM